MWRRQRGQWVSGSEMWPEDAAPRISAKSSAVRVVHARRHAASAMTGPGGINLLAGIGKLPFQNP